MAMSALPLSANLCRAEGNCDLGAVMSMSLPEGAMLFSGLVDLFLAGIIIEGLPGTAAWAIGLLIGVNLVFGGTALIAMALHARDSATAG